MNWSLNHKRSEVLAAEASSELRSSNFDAALTKFHEAARCEVEALAHLEPSKIRTIGITVVSAVSLFYKAKEFKAAKQLIHRYLSLDSLPDFASEQLHDLLRSIWIEESQIKSGVEFTKGEVIVSVSGGKVVHGGAPLDLILRKVDDVGKMFYRTIEMLMNKEFRKRGMPSQEIQEQCKPWLFQAPAGSYQFAVRVQKPAQMSLFPNDVPGVEQITEKFLAIVKAGSLGDQRQLSLIISDEQYEDAPKYRDVFLRLTRNLAPTDEDNTYSQLAIKTPESIGTPSVVLNQNSRDAINRAIKTEKEALVAQDLEKNKDLEITQLRGILRGLQLDKDWIELSVSGNPVRILETGDVIDDVVGPMVNRKVLVDVVRKNDGTYLYRDIQLRD